MEIKTLLEDVPIKIDELSWAPNSQSLLLDYSGIAKPELLHLEPPLLRTIVGDVSYAATKMRWSSRQPNTLLLISDDTLYELRIAEGALPFELGKPTTGLKLALHSTSCERITVMLQSLKLRRQVKKKYLLPFHSLKKPVFLRQAQKPLQSSIRQKSPLSC